MKHPILFFIFVLTVVTGCASPSEDDVPVINDTYLTESCSEPTVSKTLLKQPLKSVNMFDGGEGYKNGEFKSPKDIVLDKNDLYVIDYGNNRVQKFDLTGKFILSFGRFGSKDQQFNEPMSIATNNQGEIFVADTWNHKIKVFDRQGNFVKNIEHPNLNLFGPRHIAIQGSILYIADTGNHRIVTVNLKNLSQITTFGTRGTANNQFNDPTGIAVDHQQNIYVLDANNKQIKKFSSQGHFLLGWTLESWSKDFIPDSQLIFYKDHLYVPNIPQNTIDVFSVNGQLHKKITGKFQSIYGMAMTNHKLYVTDPAQNKIVEAKL